LYGRDAVLPPDLKYKFRSGVHDLKGEDQTEYDFNFVKLMKAIYQDTIASKDKEQVKCKDYYDKRYHKTSYWVGDMVWYCYHNPKKGLTLKLFRKWDEVYVIVSRTDDVTYRIKKNFKITQAHLSPQALEAVQNLAWSAPIDLFH
jgi:hypothetical protein